MKRMSQILYSLGLLTLLILSSCGSDNSTSTGSTTSALNGGSCSCSSEYMPVCGINTNNNTVKYDNVCIANCFKATNVVQGSCICSESPVCGSDGVTRTECDAQAMTRTVSNYKIVKFSDCRSR